MNRISVALFSHAPKAEPIRQRLVEAGIPAEIHSKPLLRRMWFISNSEAGARLEVPAEHFERAEQLLLDWDAAEGALREAIRCPECKSLRVLYPQFAQNSLLTNLAMGLLATTGLVEKDYYCEDCHFTWPKEGTVPRRNRPHLAPYYFIEGVEQTALAQSGQQPEQKAA
jgi:hypothetical protein